MGTGQGSFVALASYGVGHAQAPYSVAIGDLDGDGAPDLAMANAVSDTVSVLLGTGQGAFGTAASYAVAARILDSVALGDLDGDGALDLATANMESDTVSVLLGHRPGRLRRARELYRG